MKTTSILLPTLLLAALSARGGTTLESGEFAMDLRESPRVSAGTETLTYSTRWAGADALAGCTRKARFEVAGYAGAETLADVPVLVRLSSAISGFDYADFAEGAADLVFCDEAETTVYPHEIDEWNPGGESLVWVRLPVLEAGTAFKAGWGGPAATAAQTAAAAHAVWSDYAGVWHMNEGSGKAFDSTANGLDATPEAGTNALSDISQMVVCENGAVGRARVNATQLVTCGNHLRVRNYDDCHLGDTFVVSGWFHADVEEQRSPKLFYRSWGNGGGWGCDFHVVTVSRISILGGGGNASLSGFISGAYLHSSPAAAWTWICVAYHGTSASLYQDGVLVTNGTIVAATDNGAALGIGSVTGGVGSNSHAFVGQYDEVRLRGGTLSADRVRADYDMVANPGFVTCSAVETLDGASGSTVEIRLDGELFAGSLTGEGTVPWTATGPGTHEFEHVSLAGGSPVAVETATFVVPGPTTNDLSILAEGDFFPGVAVRLGGAPDGWTLHYTTNGSNPTAESPAYTGPFALDGSATVKVVAVSDAHGWTSGVAEQRFDLAPPLVVTGARARQRYPWNGLVDVDFTLEGDAARRYRVTVVAEDLDGGTNLAARTVWEDRGYGAPFGGAGEPGEPEGVVTNAALDVAPGVHRFVWNAGADLPAGFIADRVAVSLRAESIQDTALYLVVDLSGGPDAADYPISHLPYVPEGGWTDEFKTDKLVLRRIEPGTFTMGSPEQEIASGPKETSHEVTLTKPFYAGVFETTQRQWERVLGTRPSYFGNETCYATRPVETIHWPEIRGNDAGNGWPDDAEVDDGSFVASFRAKTNCNGCDLPTEAQWEYACRAGTTSSFNNGKNVTNLENDPNANLLGRNLQNGGDEGVRVIETESGTCNAADSTGTAKVGSYLSNAWGLFDMHGNVTEQCLDWNLAFTAEPAVDPVGPRDGEQLVSSVGVQRIARGGSIHHDGAVTHSGRRHGYPVTVASDFKGDDGFRLFLHDAPAVVEAPIVAPAGLTATTNRTGDVALSWQPVAGAYAYQIRRSKTGAFEDGTWLNTVTNTTYADWTAEARADYAYWVRAQFESGRVGQWSEAAEGSRHKYYTVRFNANGGTGTMADLELRFDQSQALTANAFTKSGNLFTGWATTAGGSVLYADGETVENLTLESGAIVTLYACWATSSYTVKFNKNASAATGSMADQTIARNASAALRANAFVRAGYKFAGWATSASGAKVYNDKQSVKNITTGSSITLYAVWEALTAKNALYMVIDLSGGANASSYPVTYLSAVPSGGWTDAYKTTKLVLRRIEPGTFTMGSPTSESGRESWETQHKVTLSKPFYIGVFEVTQKQYSLVMGSNPSYHKGDKKPVNGVSWNTLRGNANTYNWPSVGTVASGSFFGKVRSRIGLQKFDLPTEAQWEYACRAGTTTRYNNGSNARDGWKGLCSGWSDCPSNVGSYKVNNWGLYDMHGNVWEWCLDRSGNYPSSATTDPVGPTSGSIRICRGGRYNCGANNGWRSARRGPLEPEKNASNSYDYHGFRACLTIE